METGTNRAVGSLQTFRGLDLTVRRRLDGLLHGEYGGVRLGPGSDAEELARYQPGHDVRRIDWKVTARARQPHLWLTQAQHELDTWLLLDQTPSMAFGTVAAEKADLATTVAAAVGLLTDGPGNRLGVGVLGPIASPGRRRSRVGSRPTAPCGPARTPRRTVSQTLAKALSALAARHRRPGLRVIVSDLIDPAGAIERPFDWEAPLRRLGARTTWWWSRWSIRASWNYPRSASWCSSIPSPGGSVRSTPATAGYGPRTPAQRPSTALPRLPRSGPPAPGMSCCGPNRLGRRTRPLRPRAPSSAGAPHPEENTMTFLTPIWLLLLPVAALAAAYVVVLRRRQRYAVRFASLPMLERVVPRRPGWRRHVRPPGAAR